MNIFESDYFIPFKEVNYGLWIIANILMYLEYENNIHYVQIMYFESS